MAGEIPENQILDPEQLTDEQRAALEQKVEAETEAKIEEVEAKNKVIEEPEVPTAKKERNFNVAIVDARELAEAQARDRGDASMTESKEDRSQNIFKRTVSRIWKHNFQQERYRQDEINKVRKEILKKDNLFAGEGSDAEARKAIVERFSGEFDKDLQGHMLKEGEELRPENEALNDSIRLLVKNHAANPMHKEIFIEERNRILSHYDKKNSAMGAVYADNLFDIAEQVRDAIKHGENLDELASEIRVRLGHAKEGLNTKAQGTKFDKGMEWLQNSRVGKYFVNEAVVAAAGAIYSSAAFASERALRSKAGQVLTFGGTALAAGGLAAAKESARLERERAQHARERAKGVVFETTDKRREEMEKSKYETLESHAATISLRQSLESLSNPEIDPNVVWSQLAEIESRITLGEKRGIDLLSYSSNSQIEVERKDLVIARAKLKNALQERLGLSKEEFKTQMAEKAEGFGEELLKSERGVEAQDKIFKKMKHKKVALAGIKTTLIGAGAGLAFQEAEALGQSAAHSWFGWGKGKDSFIQGAWRNLTGKGEPVQKDATMLETWRRAISGETPRMEMGNETDVAIGSNHIRIPEGLKMLHNKDNTYSLVRTEGNVPVAEHIKVGFDKNGNLDTHTIEQLVKHDVYPSGSSMVGGSSQSAEDYLREHGGNTHGVHRELHYNNDTKITDQNEGQTKWGGEGKVVSHDSAGNVVGKEGTGIDAHGNYVLNVAGMVPKGSFEHIHGQLASVDAKEALKTHGLKVIFSLSRDTQTHVFEVPIGPDGNAIIDKNSELAKLMFENHNGQAVFTGKYAEIAQSVGKGVNGTENVRILSTVVGRGHDVITDPGVPTVRFDVPDVTNMDSAYYIPIPLARTPLEKDEGRQRGEGKLTQVGSANEAEATLAPFPTSPNTNESNVVDSIYQGEGFHETDQEVNEAQESLQEKMRAVALKISNGVGGTPEEIALYDEHKKGIDRMVKSIFRERAAPAPENLPIGSLLSKEATGRDPMPLVEYNHIRQDLEKITALVEAGKNISTVKPDVLISSYTKDILENVKSSTSKGSKIAMLKNQLQEKLLNTKINEALQIIDAKVKRGERLTDTEYSLYHDNKNTISFAPAEIQKNPVEEVGQNETEPETAPVENTKNALEHVSTMQEALDWFNTPEDIILRDYLLYKDEYVKKNDMQGLAQRYYDTHDDEGSIIPPKLKSTVDQIAKIKESGQEVQLEDTASRLVSYVEDAINQIGAKTSVVTSNKTWAYSGIADAQYRFDNSPEDSRKKDWIGNPLALSGKTADKIRANDSVQKIADMQFGLETLRIPELQEKVSEIIAAVTPEDVEKSKDANRIEAIMAKGKNNVSDSDMIELGRLIRKIQGIENITETKKLKEITYTP